MKRNLLILAVVAVGLILGGCAETVQDLKHVQSSVVGSGSVVTLYANDGTVLRQWSGRYRIEDNGGSCSFIDGGKTIKISGTYVIEEK